jgi:hypothetical protein
MRRSQRLRRMRNRFYKRNVVAPPLPLIHLIAKSEKHLCSLKVSEVNPLVLISGEVLRIQSLLAGSQVAAVLQQQRSGERSETFSREPIGRFISPLRAFAYRKV